MTFLEKYKKVQRWHEKAIIMEIFHLTMKGKGKWTLTQTAEYFGVSIGLVSENLKLAGAIHHNHQILLINSREEALKKLR